MCSVIPKAFFPLNKKIFHFYSHSVTSKYWHVVSILNTEILSGAGYSIEIDWWSFGVLVFHLIAGVMPFKSSESNILAHCILHEAPDMSQIRKLTCDENVYSFVEDLLIKNVEERLGRYWRRQLQLVFRAI